MADNKQIIKDTANNQLYTLKRTNEMEKYNIQQQDAFNQKLLAEEQKQASKATENDRFLAQRSLQNAAQGVYGAMNQAMTGSGTSVMGDMLRQRQDSDNINYWNQLQKNWDDAQNDKDIATQSVRNSYNDLATNVYEKTREIATNAQHNLANEDQSIALDTLFTGGTLNPYPYGNASTYTTVNTSGNTTGLNAAYTPASDASYKKLQAGNPGAKRTLASYNSGSTYFDKLMKGQ